MAKTIQDLETRKLADGLRQVELSKDIDFVYIASRYDNNDPEQRQHNIERAVEIGKRLANRGYIPFIPHTAIGVLDLSRSESLLLDLLWLMRCDAILYVDSTKGTDRELKIAQALEIPVFRSIDELPVSIKLDVLYAAVAEDEARE